MATYGPMEMFVYGVAKLVGGEKVPPIHQVFLSTEQAASRRTPCPLCGHHGHLDRVCGRAACRCSAEGWLADV